MDTQEVKTSDFRRRQHDCFDPQPPEPDCHNVPVGGSAFLRVAEQE